MHCKAVSSFGREIIGKSRSNLARAQLPGVGETRIAMIRTIEKPGRQRPAIYRSALAHRSRRGRQITIPRGAVENRSEEHTSELQSLMRISYAVFCWQKK